MMTYERTKMVMVAPEDALPGRPTPIEVPGRHVVLNTPIAPPFPDGYETAVVGLGCFWGGELLFWGMPGVFTTAVGYAGGYTENPTYQEVCSARTGHAEVVLVIFDPAVTSYASVLARFFEDHDPTQHMRQGGDIGTQYRSIVLTTSAEQERTARDVLEHYGAALASAGYGPVVTEIAPLGAFYYAEDYHQQYLATHPFGYCGRGGTGVECSVGIF
jgi:peptide-methionine (S)-S-oxide reductase